MLTARGMAAILAGGRRPGKVLGESARIVAVEAERRERILRLCLERRDRDGHASFGVLVCELIPNKVRFALHRQADGGILGYWGTAKDKSPVGKPYQPPEPSGRLLPGRDASSEWRDRLASADASLEKAARRWLAGADASIVRELIFRSQQGEGDEPATALWNAATEAYTGAVTGQSYVWQEAGRFHVSALEPRRLQGAYEQFDAVSPGIWAACQKEREQRRTQQKHQQIPQAAEPNPEKRPTAFSRHASRIRRGLRAPKNTNGRATRYGLT